jgi:hypothetical protein
MRKSFRSTGEIKRSISKCKRLASVFAATALLAASPAAAQTVVMYFNSGHILVGYVVYGNDGHICQQSGIVTNNSSTYQVDGDC